MRFLPILFILSGTLFAGPGPLLAQTPPPASTSETSVPAAVDSDKLLNQLCEFLKGQSRFSFDADIVYDNVLDSGQKVQYSAYQTVLVSKPDRMQVIYTGDERNTRFYFDGQNFTWIDSDNNHYATESAPASIDDLVDLLQNDYGMSLPLSSLVVSDPCTTASSNIKSKTYVGLNMVNRVPAHQLLITGEDRDWQVWLTDGPQPVPLKIVITYKKFPGVPQYTAVLSNWKTNPAIATGAFSFSPTADMKRIDFLPKTADNSDAVQPSGN